MVLWIRIKVTVKINYVTCFTSLCLGVKLYVEDFCYVRSDHGSFLM